MKRASTLQASQWNCPCMKIAANANKKLTTIGFERHVFRLPLLLEGAHKFTVAGNVAPVDHFGCYFVGRSTVLGTGQTTECMAISDIIGCGLSFILGINIISHFLKISVNSNRLN